MLAFDDRTQVYRRPLPPLPRFPPLPPPRLPGLPGDVPGPSFTGGLPGGCGSTPLPTPLLPRGLSPPDAAIAGDASDVDSSTVIAGGTVSEYLPQPFRKARRSLARVVGVVVLISSMAQSSLLQLECVFSALSRRLTSKGCQKLAPLYLIVACLQRRFRHVRANYVWISGIKQRYLEGTAQLPVQVFRAGR